MEEIKNSINGLGYDDWFQSRSDPEKLAIHKLARVIAVHKDSYVLSRGDGGVFAELAGKLLYAADSPTDLPATGDWVYADFYDDDSHAIIHDVLPRKTLIKRKTSGKNVEFQLISSNIDIALIVQSLDHNFNLRRLERYLVMVNESGIHPIVLLSKCDLVSEEEARGRVQEILKMMPGLEVIRFSNENFTNLERIKELMLCGKTYCLLGSSGVGKTTLLNRILGNKDLFETKPVREKDSKGRHTTTNRQLLQLDSGAMLIDTPGMRELGNMSVDDGISETFSEIVDLSEKCKFSNCTHVNEKGCAILAAISSGALCSDRYQNFLSMKRESDYNEMSYLEKKQKDKNFGKLIKSVMKDKNRR